MLETLLALLFSSNGTPRIGFFKNRHRKGSFEPRENNSRYCLKCRQSCGIENLLPSLKLQKRIKLCLRSTLIGR